MVGAVFVGVESDSNTGDERVVGGADGERMDIEIASREEGSDTD